MKDQHADVMRRVLVSLDKDADAVAILASEADVMILLAGLLLLLHKSSPGEPSAKRRVSEMATRLQGLLENVFPNEKHQNPGRS